jgi:hypothetical protein
VGRGRKGERQWGGGKGVMGEGINEMKCFSGGRAAARRKPSKEAAADRPRRHAGAGAACVDRGSGLGFRV